MLAGRFAFGDASPGGHGGSATGSTTTMWVIDRVHSAATDFRSFGAMSIESSFADDFESVVFTTDGAKDSTAARGEAANFTGGEAECGMVVCFVLNDGMGTGGAGSFSTTVGGEFDIADGLSSGDIA